MNGVYLDVSTPDFWNVSNIVNYIWDTRSSFSKGVQTK